MQVKQNSVGMVVLIISFLVFGARAQARDLERHEYRKLVMGTEARLVLYTQDVEKANQGAQAAFARMVELDERLSHWKNASEVSAIARAQTQPVRLSEDLATVLSTALAVAERSQGVFDPLLGRTLQPDGVPRPSAEPQGDPILWSELHLVDGLLTFPLAGRDVLRIDLGGIAKGFAADEALSVLGDLGIGVALVDIGGDLALASAPPLEEGWLIRVGEGEILPLSHCGIATSGSTGRSYEINGVQHSHVYDPSQKRGVTHQLSTTVIAPSGMLADALATVANVHAEGDAAFVATQFPEARVLVRKPGFTELFDGKTLNGWTTEGGRYDGNAVWSVQDGAIVGRTGANGEGGLLYTTKTYASFDFECEVRMDWPFDSGVFVRMVPPGGGKGLQVTLDARPGGEVGAVYADGFLAHNKQGVEHWKRDDWNHVRVRCIGFETQLQAWVNGTQVTNYTMEPGLEGYAPTGLIGIQVHPDAEGKVEAARFRNLRVKPLPMFGDEQFNAVPESATNLVTPAAGTAWRALFNGQNTDGWDTVGSDGNYVVSDGVLAVPAEGSGWIRTVETFRDFRVRVDFKMAAMANSGLYLRSAPDDTNPSYSGCEIQILDDFNWEAGTNSTLAPYQFTGSLYGAQPVGDRTALRPIGQWNSYEVLVRGERMACSLNGRVLWDVFTNQLEAKPPFAERAERGCIGFQRYGAPFVKSANAAWFKNVYLQELAQ